tara:strand:+ start:75 stop:443 length:369 start_codon:yes stop_codon:yes gene_type:complete
MEQEYPDSVRIFPNNDNSNGEIDVTVFFRVNGEEHRLRIYKNNRKEEGDKRPDLLVTLRLNGKELEANSWQKEAKETGKVYYQGTPKPKSEGYSKSGSFKEVITEKREEKSVVKGFDDEIPF